MVGTASNGSHKMAAPGGGANHKMDARAELATAVKATILRNLLTKASSRDSAGGGGL